MRYFILTDSYGHNASRFFDVSEKYEDPIDYIDEVYCLDKPLDGVIEYEQDENGNTPLRKGSLIWKNRKEWGFMVEHVVGIEWEDGTYEMERPIRCPCC